MASGASRDMLSVIFATYKITSCPLRPDGCRLSVLLTFSYKKQKLAIFPAFSCMMLLDILCQQIVTIV